MSRERTPALCETKRRYAKWRDAQRHVRFLKRYEGASLCIWHCVRHACFHVGSVDRIGRAR